VNGARFPGETMHPGRTLKENAAMETATGSPKVVKTAAIYRNMMVGGYAVEESGAP